MNKQVLVAFTILLLALATTGITYSHWIDTARVRTTVNMAEFSIYIQAYNNTKAQLSTDKHTLEILDTITLGQTNWTGIIIKNNGTTPAKITYAITTNDPEAEKWFSNQTHFYGPYKETDDISAVWDKAATMPPSGGSLTPPELSAKYRLVAWQNITLSGTPTHAFTIEITVTYTATFSSWTDKVYVIYTLTYPPP
jgi:type II secretory pathway pseudopilin PulG